MAKVDMIPATEFPWKAGVQRWGWLFAAIEEAPIVADGEEKRGKAMKVRFESDAPEKEARRAKDALWRWWHFNRREKFTLIMVIKDGELFIIKKSHTFVVRTRPGRRKKAQ